MNHDHSLLQIENLFGLIGYPLSHSFSKNYFTNKFAEENIKGHGYTLFPVETIDVLSDILNSFPNLKGLNVTIPYKQKVIQCLDEIHDEALAIGAVNTIQIENGKLIGFNTDVYGFEKSLLNTLPTDELGKPVLPLKALVLGTGGAAKAITFVLRKLGIEYKRVSRHRSKGDLTYAAIDSKLVNEYSLVVNTTPLGMAPNIETCPDLPYKSLTSRNVLYDLVYNPEKTLFLKKGIQQNCICKNGMEMLHLQAEKAWEIWSSTSNIK